MAEHGREFDLILWGSSGFTGRLVAEYLLRQYGANGDVRWAMGGRNEAKLTQVRDELGAQAAEVPLVIGDSHDSASLQAMAARAAVVCTTVGPYAKYGNELVAACVGEGTHYCDLTGEPQFIRKTMDEHLHDAAASGARIVHSCGFDSIPSDIGVQFIQAQAMEKFGRPASHVKYRVRAFRGGFSGGTVDSMMTMIDQIKEDPSIRKVLGHPYCLNPEGERSGPDRSDQKTVLWDEDFASFTAPFVMAGINTRIVRRSNAVMGYPYGKDMRYDEAVLTKKGLAGWTSAFSSTVGTAGMFIAGSSNIGRKAMYAMGVPRPGQGPNQQQRETGYFNIILLAKMDDGNTLRARVRGDRDPGYGSTCKMLGESAVCLAKDALSVGGGIWTPASAMGDALRTRLETNAGVTFTLE